MVVGSWREWFVGDEVSRCNDDILPLVACQLEKHSCCHPMTIMHSTDFWNPATTLFGLMNDNNDISIVID